MAIKPKKQEEITKIDAVLVTSDEALEASKEKPKTQIEKKLDKIKLKNSDHYIRALLQKTPEEIITTLFQQTDVLLMLSKELAIQALEEAASGNAFALDSYQKLIQGSAIIADEKVKLHKAIMGDGPSKHLPKPYKATEMTQEQWEKEFKPEVKVEDTAVSQTPPTTIN